MPDSMSEDSFEYIQPSVNSNNNEQFLLNKLSSSPVKQSQAQTSMARKPQIQKQKDENIKIDKSNLTFHVNQEDGNRRNANKLWQQEMNLISIENFFHNKDLVAHQYINKVRILVTTKRNDVNFPLLN